MFKLISIIEAFAVELILELEEIFFDSWVFGTIKNVYCNVILLYCYIVRLLYLLVEETLVKSSFLTLNSSISLKFTSTNSCV